ncbi:hypothetical protein Ntsu_74720 [Nocardia sp. IFM 10818]
MPEYLLVYGPAPDERDVTDGSRAGRGKSNGAMVTRGDGPARGSGTERSEAMKLAQRRVFGS